MKIYKDMLNEIKSFSVNEDVFETEENLQKYIKYLQGISEYLFGDNAKLKYNFVKVVLNHCRPNNSYVLHKFKEYYAISLLCDIWEPQEVSDEIRVFDENNIYPLQKIKVSIEWDY